QVEHPVLEPELLGRKVLSLLARYRNRRCFRWPNHHQVRDLNFNLARYHRLVASWIGPERHGSGDLNDGLDAEGGRSLHYRRGRPVGIERKLDDAVAIPKVDEDQAAKIPTPMNPAGEPDSGAEISPVE